MRGDGKDKFYRSLNLDKTSLDALKFFRKNVEELKDEIIDDEDE
jgi:hypothetical protein